jgi:hypothetical protein
MILAICGFYWISGIRQIMDCDVDDYGVPIGRESDEIEQFISLVEIDYEPGYDYEIAQVFIGSFDFTTDTITHYAMLQQPALPAVVLDKDYIECLGDWFAGRRAGWEQALVAAKDKAESYSHNGRECCRAKADCIKDSIAKMNIPSHKGKRL